MIDRKYVIGLVIGIFTMFLFGTVNGGGTGTYQTQMSYDGKTIAVMDTREIKFYPLPMKRDF
jgi:hypothetical protein